MILKYLKKDTWGFMDGITQYAYRMVDDEELEKQFNKEVEEGTRSKDLWTGEVEVIGECEDGSQEAVFNPYEPNIAKSNVIFGMACEDFQKRNPELLDVHYENHINEEGDNINLPIYIMVMYFEKDKDYDALVIVTNQQAYLLNDKGGTIERIV
jgi:hypothetical protein